MDNKYGFVVFDMNNPSNIRDAVMGRKVGTVVCDELPSRRKFGDMAEMTFFSTEMAMEKTSITWSRIRCGAHRQNFAKRVENADVHAHGSTMSSEAARDHDATVCLLFNRSTPARCPTSSTQGMKIGITPAVESKIIRYPSGAVRRHGKVVRSLGKMAEEARVRVRANQHAAL
jgi:hypothetical protein